MTEREYFNDYMLKHEKEFNFGRCALCKEKALISIVVDKRKIGVDCAKKIYFAMKEAPF